MRAGNIIVCVSLVLMNFQFPIDVFSNTDGPTFPLEVSTDKYYYVLGENVSITLSNVGTETITFPWPYDHYIVESDGNVVVDTRLCWPRLAVVIKISPGSNISDEWGQAHLICDESNDPVPPSFEQVPPGKYRISVGFDTASYGNQTMPIWDSVWIEIGSGNSPPVADAGPDQTIYVNDIVQFDGSGSHDPDTGWETTTVAYAPLFFGPWTSIALDSTDYPHISYNDITNGNLSYAKWTGNAWLEETIDSVGDVGRYTSLAIDSDDNPHVAYYEQISGINGNLKYAKWNGTAWNIETVDIIGSVGRWTSIALDNSGNPHMSYYDETNQNLKYARWTGRAWINETVDSGGDVGLTTSIALDSDDNPHISYYEEISPFDGDLKYAYRTGSKWSIETVDSAGHVGLRSSIALDSNDHPRMSYFDFTNNSLKYARWNGTAWNIEVVYSSTPDGHIGWSSSIAIDGNDYPHVGIGIYPPGGPPSINYAKRTGGMWTVERVGAGDRAGVSLALDSNDNPHISHLSGADMELKYARKVGGIVSYDWNFDDGSPRGTGKNPIHVYDKAGVFNVTLTVTDTQGASDSDYCIITVLQAGQPPVANAGPDQTVDEGDTVLFNGSGSFDPDGGAENWKSKTNIPSPRAGGASAVLNGEIYYVGGNSFDLIPGPSSVFQKYNPSTDSWSDLPDLPEPRVFLGAAAVNGRIYAIGGYVGNLSTNTTYEFDPITNNWISKAPIPIPMEAFGTAVVNERIYVVGGSSTFVWCYPCADVFEYNPFADSWSKKPDLPTGRARLATAVLDDKIYAIGGDAYVAVGAVEVYDPSTGIWTKRANMTTPRSGLRAEVLGGKIYAFGGIISWDLGVDVNEMYDPLSDNWTSKPSMLDLRMDFGSGVVGNCMYGVGGYRGWMGGHPNSTEEYCLDGEIVYEWDVDPNVDSDGDGNYTNDVDVSGPTPTHVYGDNGNYTVTLKVTDGSGLWDTDTCIITVLNVPPTADANGPYHGFEGTPVHFDGNHTDPGANDTHTYEWDFNYDGTTFTPDATGNPSQKTWYDDYSGNIALKVTDDDGGWDMDVTAVTVVNVPPRAEAGEDKEGFEVSTFTFNGSFYDPGANDTHEYAWDFDYDGISFDVEATGQSVSHTFVDDFDGEIALRVTDDDGGVGIDTAHVLVKNVPPTVTLEVLPIEVDAFLRIAGEKWHDVSIELFEDGVLVANGTLVRYPGSPNDQMLDLSNLQFDYSKKYTATVTYTPDDDPINGQPNGANPCWIILNFSDGQELSIQHTFNVNHPDTYGWEVDLIAAILSHGVTFKAIAFDPGADELTFHWDFGDGTNVTTFYPNVNETYPVEIMEIINHVFPGSGTYTVTVTVEDDDGGIGVAMITVTIP